MGYKLEIAPAGNNAAWRTLAEQSAAATNTDATLALTNIDPATLANGVYQLRLSAWDLVGRTTTINARVVIDTEQKNLSGPAAVDAVYTLAGHSFAVYRSLDTTSLDVGSQEFGNWRLPALDTGLTSDQPVSTDTGAIAPWSEGAQVWLNAPNLAPNLGSAQTVAPASLRFKLSTTSEALGSQPGAPTVLHPVFASNQGWTLEANDTLIRQGHRLYSQLTGLPWVPTGYTLSGPDGTRYTLDAAGQVTAVKFADGAQWLVSDAGVVGSAPTTTTPLGRVDFIRDDKGRISRVTGVSEFQAGTSNRPNTTVYRYDAQNRLILARALDTTDFGTPYAYDAANQPLVETITSGITANLGAAVNWVSAQGTQGRWSGLLQSGQGSTLAFAVRDSELASGLKAPGAQAAVIIAIESQFADAQATLQVTGATVLGTTSVNGVQTTLVHVTEAGVKLIRLLGTGTAQIRVSIAGDANHNGLVDGADTATTAAERQILFANYGFKANTAPTAASSLPVSLTHTDLATSVVLGTVAQDLEGDQVFWRVLGATHGTAKLSGDGASLVFMPDANYSGPATITVQADDGFAASAPIDLVVNVSGAKLVAIYIERLATLRNGSSTYIHVAGDFEDEAGVKLSGNYLTYISSNSNVLSTRADGLLRGLGDGTAVLRVVARGIEGVNVFTVSTDLKQLALDDNGFEVDVYPLAITLPVLGQRQLKVKELDHTNISGAISGTKYFISDGSIAEISPDGLIVAKAAGTARLSVINGGRQHDILLKVEVPQIGAGTVVLNQGLIVQDIDGNQLMIAPNSVQAGTIAEIKGVSLNSLDVPLPAPEVLDTLAAFRIDLTGGEAELPMQLAVKIGGVLDPTTNTTEVPPTGTQVMFWRKGTVLDTDGSSHDTWWLVDNGFVGADGIARTSSPPYSGISGGGGVFAVTTINLRDKIGNPDADKEKLAKDTGEFEVTGAMLNFNLLWAQTAGISMAVGSGSALMAVSAMGVFATLASPVSAIRYTIEGSFKVLVPKTDLSLANVNSTFPAAPSTSVYTPQITGLDFNPETRKLKVSGVDFVPSGQASAQFDLKIWLVPRGDQIAVPTVFGTPPLRGLIWQGLRTASISSTELEATLPDGVALSMHDVYVERVSKVPGSKGKAMSSIAVDSNPVEAWGLGTNKTLITTAHTIQVYQPQPAAENGAPGALTRLLEVTKDEKGAELQLYGSYTDQIVFSEDGTLAFIAAREGKIYVLDTQTLTVVHTLVLEGNSAPITSLAISGNWLYATEGSAYGPVAGRLIRVNVDQMSRLFLREQQTIKFKSNAPLGFHDMAISNGSFLALTASKMPNSVSIYGQHVGGNVYVLDLWKIDRANGTIDDKAIVEINDQNWPLTNGGKRDYAPRFITAGNGSGEFIVSSSKSTNNGLVGIKVSVDDKGNLTNTVNGSGVKLSPNDNYWTSRFLQNIQRAQGNVLVNYGGKEYALVADYNFNFNDPLFNSDNNYGLGKQIGGKIGVIEDPFGKAGAPKYLGATTPIVGGAVDHLTLGQDGKLYADVFIYDDVINNGMMYKAIFVWNASALVQAAIDTNAGQFAHSIRSPIDRIDGVTTGAQGQRPGALPQRFNGRVEGDYFGWTYGIGAYSAPGRDAQLGTVKYNYPTLEQLYGEPNVYKEMLGISQRQVVQQKDDGTYSAFQHLAATTLYNGWNFFTLGFVDKQAERYNKLSDGSISEVAYYTASGTDGLTTIASMAVGGQIAKRSIEFSRYGKNAWQVAGLNAAEAGLATVIQKEGEVLSYQITDPGKLDAKYWKNAATELTVASALGAGLPFIATLMSAEGRGNFKALFNSPNTLNPTQVKIVQATPSARGKELYGSLADTTGGSITSHAGGEVITPSGKSFGVPAQASMTVKQANEWQIKIGSGLETLVNLKATVREQAAQAVRMANDIMLAARNAMEDANAAAQLMMTNPIRSFNELLETFGKEFSGDVLYKKVIEKAKDMVSKLLVLPRTITEAGACFAAGTLVHTKDGLKPIEKIQVGDWVLSKPEDGEGAQAYKRVARTFSFEDKSVRRIRYAVMRDGEWQQEYLIVTGNHPFWVPEIDKSGYSEGFFDHLKIGWTRADELYPGSLIELRTGQQARVMSTSLNRLWKTKQPDVALDSKIDSENGSLVNIYDGSEILSWSQSGFQTYLHDDDTFMYREDDPVWAEKWTYCCKVYNFEVEDFHTYYVGNLGAWVHNTNCYATTVDYLKKNGVLPSIDGQAFFTVGQVQVIVKEMIAQKVAPKGMVLVKELVTNQLEAKWVKYQRGVEGGLFLGKAGEESFFARSLIYLNDITTTNPKNVIKLGDGAAYIYDGLKKILSKTTIDAKSYNSKWTLLKNEIDAAKKLEYEKDLVQDIARASSALRQNPGFSHVIEFASYADLQTAIGFFKQIGNDPKWATEFGANWLSKDIYLTYGKDLGPGVKRVLSDDLVGFTLKPGANGTFELIEKAVNKKDVLKPMEQNQGFLADIKKIFGDNEPGYQLTDSPNTLELTTDRLVSSAALSTVFAQAKAYWLQHGAFASVLSAVELSIESLPYAALAQTIGKTITLSPDAAGWGWFVDATPAENEEFSQLGASQEYQAQTGSAAAGKVDLLGVLIHEIGHVLGLEHSEDAHDEMAATVSPGLRRLLGSDGRVYATGIGQTVYAATTVSPAANVAPAQYATVVNPTLTNGQFSTVNGWAIEGSVSIATGAATLAETATQQTRLNQVFIVGPQDRYLSFTLSGIALDDAVTGLDDALEVALLDANSGTSLVGPIGMTHTDALLNLQANGAELAASGVTHVTNQDGSRTYLVDLTGVASVASGGTAVNLSFDLIGFGSTAPNLGSHATVSQVRLLAQKPVPQTLDDSSTTAEDTVAHIIALANDLDTNQVGMNPVVVTGPMHGQVVVNADGSFDYTPDANYFGTDSFTYQVGNGVVQSNVSTVSITITPVNDAPVAPDLGGVQATVAEDATLTIDLLAQATDVEGDTLTTALVAGPQHGTLSVNADGTFSYAADANYFGSDSFTYRVTDGSLESGIATVNLTITAVNDAPVAADVQATVLEDGTVAITLVAADADNTWAEGLFGIKIRPLAANFKGTGSFDRAMTAANFCKNRDPAGRLNCPLSKIRRVFDTY